MRFNKIIALVSNVRASLPDYVADIKIYSNFFCFEVPNTNIVHAILDSSTPSGEVMLGVG